MGSHAVVLLAELQVEDNGRAPGVVITLTGAGIAVFLLFFFNWVVGHALTLAHEGGHALAAVLLGGKVESITTSSDRTGLTVATHPKGRFGPLDAAVYLGAGYIAPSLFGLAAADALGHGRADVVLWTTIVLLAITLPSVRSVFAFFTVVVFGTVMVLVVVRGDEQYQLISATTWAWLLLAGGLFGLVDHFEQGTDFSLMSPKFLGPMFLAIVYTVASVAVMIVAGLILVGAKEPFL